MHYMNADIHCASEINGIPKKYYIFYEHNFLRYLYLCYVN